MKPEVEHKSLRLVELLSEDFQISPVTYLGSEVSKENEEYMKFGLAEVYANRGFRDWLDRQIRIQMQKTAVQGEDMYAVTAGRAVLAWLRHLKNTAIFCHNEKTKGRSRMPAEEKFKEVQEVKL